MRAGQLFNTNVQDRWLEPREAIDQTVELRSIWMLPAGLYSIAAKRGMTVADRSVTVTASSSIDVPAGFDNTGRCVAAQSIAPKRAFEAELAKMSIRSAELEASLTRPIQTEPNGAFHDLSTAFVRVLRGTAVSGGMAVWGSDSIPEGSVCVVTNRRVLDVLDDMHLAMPNLRLDWGANVVNLLDDRTSTFLESRVESLEFPNPVTNPLGAVHSVLSAPEVVQAMRLLGLDNMAPSNSLSNTPASDGAPVRLQNVTVREALNAIVQMHGNGIWLYREHASGLERRAFKLDLSFWAR